MNDNPLMIHLNVAIHKTVCGKLVVGPNFPFAQDTCTGTMYQLLDGTLFSGDGQYPLIEYFAAYDGALLHIYN